MTMTITKTNNKNNDNDDEQRKNVSFTPNLMTNCRLILDVQNVD